MRITHELTMRRDEYEMVVGRNFHFFNFARRNCRDLDMPNRSFFWLSAQYGQLRHHRFDLVWRHAVCGAYATQ
jgi:hypothetical protein